MPAAKKTLEHYLREVRRIEEHREKWCEQNVRRHYRDCMTDLQEFLGVEYAKLAQDDKLTYEILQSKGEYARFLEEVENKTTYFSKKAAQEIKDTVQLTYKHTFEGMVSAVEKSSNYEELKLNLKGLKGVTPDVIKNAVSNTFLEDALEKNHKSVIYDIKQQLGIGLSQGDRMSTMSRRITEQLNKDYKKATQIVRTECHRVREAGYQDASERISQKLQETDSDYVMIKTWKTMQDMAVRPYRRKGKKGKISFVLGKGPNHLKMQGVTVLAEELFDLGDGAKAKSPGQSGVAGHDINCRCYLSRDMITKEEYEKRFGKKPKGWVDPAEKYETQEKVLLDEKENLEDEKDKLQLQKLNLESKEYTGIWKDTVTPADYELKKAGIPAKRQYYEDDILAAQNRTGKYANTNWYSDADLANVITKDKDYLKMLDDFEAQGKAYAKLTKQIADIDVKMPVIDNDIKDIRQKIMKAKGIDPDKMQQEIDDIMSKINKLNQPGKSSPLEYLVKDVDPDEMCEYLWEAKLIYDPDTSVTKEDFVKYMKSKLPQFSSETLEQYAEKFGFEDELKEVFKSKIKVSSPKNLTLQSKVEDFDPDILKAAFKELKSSIIPYTDSDIDQLISIWHDDSIKKMIDMNLMSAEQVEFKQALKKLIKNNPDDAKELKRLQKLLSDKQDELEKIRKRYGLEDDAFSQARKNNAYWFTDANGGAEAADKVYRPKAGEVWRGATKAQKDSAYEYTQSYHKYNEPLRGIEYGTNKFLGVGKVNLDDIGVSTGYGYSKGEVHKLIDDLTDYIDKSSYDADIWLNRGCRRSGMDKFFNVDPSDFNLSEKELAAKILGTTPTEYGFMSTGTARGSGFSGEIKLNIYAPKGTKMAYVEPFSAFGHGDGKNWDGIKQQSSIGYEAEMLLQRNTKFRVIKVEKSGSQWYIDMEVISQKR